MCDEKTERENEAWLARKGLTRRTMGVMGLSAGAAAMLPGCANSQEGTDAVELVRQDVEIETAEGLCDAYFVHPAKGAHAAVLVCPDIYGLRPAFRQMGDRLASSGYAVLTYNPFYRSAVAPVTQPGDSFSDPEVREKLLGYRSKMSSAGIASDAVTFTTWLAGQSAVDASRGMGTTGYCMGGPVVFRTAAAAPDHIKAAATFHGGGLATDGEDSPHLLIPKMDANFLIAIAENDDEKQPEAKTVLKDAFAANDIGAEIEVYEDAMHGWCPPDSRVYNEAQAEKAWSRLLALLDANLA